MNKKYGFVLFSCFGLGNLILLISKFYSDIWSEFALGFMEGISLILIVVGTVYLLYCVITKTHPLKSTANN